MSVTRSVGLVDGVLVPSLALVALALDYGERHTEFSVISTGLLDEPTHLATAGLGLLVLAQLWVLPRRFVFAALAASVLIDLDHIPLYLGLHVSATQDGRPVSHSMITFLIATIVAAILRSPTWGGISVGVAFHFVRDLTEGPPGVPLAWPLSGHGFQIDWPAFLVLVLLLLTLRWVLTAWRMAAPDATSASRENPTEVVST